MIHYFNLVLRKLLENNLVNLGVAADQIGFDPPDENWRKFVSDLNKRAVNIYLADVRENRARRANEGRRQIRNGIVRETPPARWLDCHYLITAWYPAVSDIAHGVEPTLEENAILSSVAAVLLDAEIHSPTPGQIFGPGNLPPGFPPEMARAKLPPLLLPAEGFPKLAEFWGTMGAGYRWKPAVYLVAALPVIRADMPLGPPVTTLVSGYGQAGDDTTEKLIEIGGRVLDTQHPLPDTNPAPVIGAMVRLETAGGIVVQDTLTDGKGSFVFSRLSEGNYNLHALAEGLGEKTLAVEVTAGPHGSDLIKYDISF